MNFLISGIILLLIQTSIFFETGNHISVPLDNKLKEQFMSMHIDNPVVSPQDILFVVKHSQGPNVVVYQANITVQKNLDDKKPINVFWLMNSKGKTTEDLTMIEWKLAFGFKLIPMVKGKKYKILLNAIKDRYITIIQDEKGKTEGFISLNGHYTKLESVFIKFEHSFYIPNVQYVELSGSDTVSGKLITERIVAE